MTVEGLGVEGVTVKRGELPIVRDVSLECAPGQVTVLLGANGAGKTTLLDGIAGVIPIASGAVTLDGTAIHRFRRNKRAARGLAYVEQGRTIFPDLTVEDNLRVAVARGEDVESAFELFPSLAARRHVHASLISGGEQQMLVLARGFISRPKVLLIDEMSLGLAPVIVKRLLPFVRNAAEQGIAVVLVEQFAALALEIGDNAYVLNCGEVVLSGTCSELLAMPERLRAAYLHDATLSDTLATYSPNGASASRAESHP